MSGVAVGAMWEIRTTDVLSGLRAMPDACVQLCVTSPPYFNLRAYSTNPQIWGGDPRCSHTLAEDPARRLMTGGTGSASAKQITNNGSQFGNAWVDEGTTKRGNLNEGFNHRWNPNWAEGGAQVEARPLSITHGASCTICGAWKGELGSEPTPGAFVSHLVEVFREVHRVLHPTGLLAVNLGDSYAGSGKGPTTAASTLANGRGAAAKTAEQRQGFVNQRSDGGVSAKSLMLIPERFALAMLDDGWIVRSRLAGVKVAPMPESCRDRPTSAWEHVYLFSKSRSYYWDQDAVRQPLAASSVERMAQPYNQAASGYRAVNGAPDGDRSHLLAQGANMRNWFYWPPANFAGAHFATWPTSVPETFIKAGSRPGDLVLDCFSGAGTTVLVANRLGRRGLGLELNPDYAQMARDRIQADAPLCHAIAAAGPAVQVQRGMFGE